MLGLFRRSALHQLRGFALVLLTLGALVGCAGVPLTPAPGPRVTAIAVIDRGWHTEIGLPVGELTPPLSLIAARFPGAKVLTFGFGDRDFVLGKHGHFADALGALLPSPGLILVTALNTSPEAAFGARDVVELPISRAGFAHIAHFIGSGIAREKGEKPNEAPAPYGPGPYPGALFYASSVTYDAFNTCNTWVASALRSGGIPVRAAGVLFASQVMSEVRRVRAQQGGAKPFGQTAGAGATGTTVVSERGGGGLLLLNERQPLSRSGARSTKTDQRSRRITFLLDHETSNR